MSVAPYPEDELPVVIRPMGDDARERSFVRETTIKVRWPRRSGIPWREWERTHGPLVDGWLAGAHVVVAESGGVLLGFCVLAEPGPGAAVAMIYVKAAFRGAGIGRRLLTADGQRGLGIHYPELATLRVVQPTPCWSRWAAYHKLRWEPAR